MEPAEEPLAAPVPGGLLAGTVWHRGTPGTAVLALHGITATHRCWPGLARRIRTPLVAPDLRGRGASRDLPGPFDLATLADDAAAALDAVEVDRAVVVGHSMGAFVAVVLAHRHPDRVASLVLVDGGLPLPPVENPAAALGPALDRLTMTFASPEAYRDFWRGHPALGPYWGPAIEEYVDYDLVPGPDGWHASARPEAVLAASAQFSEQDLFVPVLAGSRVPITLLRSPRGLFDETPPLYPQDRLDAWQERFPGVRVVQVPDTNHYTILLGSGIDAVAEATTRALAATMPGPPPNGPGTATG